MGITNPMLVTFFIYITGMILIGFWAYKSTSNFDDYILGGRSLGSVVTALSTGASDMSGWLLMGLPGAVYLSGISEGWIAVGLIMGAYLNWKFVAQRLRLYTEIHDNALTLPDYLSNRFEDKSKVIRLISAFVILIFFTIYCSSGIVAGARLFESTFNISYSEALWIGALATISYTFIGGFLAVSWTDTIQASLMIFALILTPIIVVYHAGGLHSSIQAIEIASSSNTDIFNNLGVISIISLLGWGLGYFGQPHILARFMAAESHHTIKNARRIAMTWMTLCLTGAVAVGFFGIAYFIDNPAYAGIVNKDSENVFIELAKLLFNPWISGVLLSAILAAIMSSLSCQLLVCSSAITEDLYKSFFRPKAGQKELVWVGRMMVLLVAIVAIALAQNPNNKVLGLVSYAWAGFGAAFGPVILISLFWPRMTKNGALAGMIVGAVTVLVWKHFSFFHLYEIIPGFIFASLSIAIFSLMDQVPSKKTTKRLLEAARELQSSR